MAVPFPLTPVLRLREQKEENEERLLIAINADLQQVRAAIARVEQETARFGSVREQMTREVLSAAHHQMLALQWRSLQEAHAQLRTRLHFLEKSRAKQQESLLIARRERETLSELFARYKEGLKEEAEKLDRKRLDDLFSARHGRTMNEARRHTAARMLRNAHTTPLSSKSNS